MRMGQLVPYLTPLDQGYTWRSVLVPVAFFLTSRTGGQPAGG
jgi:hypothetical protein